MPQNQETGRKASRWGQTYGKKIISKLGGKPVRAGSNEFLLDGKRYSLHCAHEKTSSVGVTYKMLDRVVAVLAAFEQGDGTFLILRLSRKQYKGLMRETRSLGPSNGRVGMVSRGNFQAEGTTLSTVRV
jgi:hypothetical protein